MKRTRLSPFNSAILLPVAALALLLPGCTSLPSGPSKIDPDAKAILQQAAASLAAAESFSFRVRRDVPTQIAKASGMDEKADIRVSVQRPNKVMALNSSGAQQNRFFYDGARITRYSAVDNSYATAKAPATIDAMITFLDKEWNSRPPLAGLLVDKPFQSALQKAQSGKLVGKESIAGESCNHITLTGKGVVWDLWFSSEDHLPRRFDVTLVEVEGAPRGRTMLSDWDLDATFPKDHFKASLPSGATQRKVTEMR